MPDLSHRRSRRRIPARPIASLVGALLAAGVAAADRPAEIRYETPGAVPLLRPDVAAAGTATILLTDHRLSPSRIEIGPDHRVQWLSYSRYGARIAFDREVARSMVCHRLVNFQLDEDTLRSATLTTGDVASFCKLAPGRYRYRVERVEPGIRPSPGSRSPSSRLSGVIVVNERD